MIQAMYSGISGLNAFKSSLDVIGNNIANLNTVGYKAGRATFKEMMSQTLSGASGPTDTSGGVNPKQLGLGVTMGSIDFNWEQGSMQATGRSTDLAIEGNGFFCLGDGSRMVYSRDGSFGLDGDNNLVSTATGAKVLGWQADPTTGEVDTSEQVNADTGINIPIGLMSTARQTTEVNLGGNLNAGETIGKSWSAEFYAYDSLGLAHKVLVSFTKADNTTVDGVDKATWDYSVTCPDVGTDPVASGSMTFSTEGKSELQSVPVSLDFSKSNGSFQPVDFTLDTSAISQLGGEDSVGETGQDGLALGTLENYSVGKDGTITGTFTNGSSRSLGQLAIADVRNPAGLSKIGNNLYVESANSGVPQIGVAQNGSRGKISAGYLEASNVDLASEFANMIVAQRGFQANSRIITTSDEVLQDLVSLKR